tara:strand:+ start:122 stop:607 length:486 start_codon:yes stop_codon:yes gene_type:complete
MAEIKKTRIAVIRIKGKPGLKFDVKETFEKLRLYKKNTCIVVPNNPVYLGMINKIKEASTWGEIDEETFKLLLEKRAKLPGKKALTEEYLKQKLKTDFNTFAKDFMNFNKEIKDVPGMKNFFKLNPPIKGFEAKGIKVPFSLGGVLGYRKDKINTLIRKMV